MCMYVCMYVCMHACMHTDMRTRTCTRTCTDMYECMYVHKCMHVYTHACATPSARRPRCMTKQCILHARVRAAQGGRGASSNTYCMHVHMHALTYLPLPTCLT